MEDAFCKGSKGLCHETNWLLACLLRVWPESCPGCAQDRNKWNLVLQLAWPVWRKGKSCRPVKCKTESQQTFRVDITSASVLLGALRALSSRRGKGTSARTLAQFTSCHEWWHPGGIKTPQVQPLAVDLSLFSQLVRGLKVGVCLLLCTTCQTNSYELDVLWLKKNQVQDQERNASGIKRMGSKLKVSRGVKYVVYPIHQTKCRVQLFLVLSGPGNNLRFFNCAYSKCNRNKTLW